MGQVHSERLHSGTCLLRSPGGHKSQVYPVASNGRFWIFCQIWIFRIKDYFSFLKDQILCMYHQEQKLGRRQNWQFHQKSSWFQWWMFRYHLHEQEQQLENNGGGEIGDDKFCGIEKVVQVTFILHWEGNTYLGKIQWDWKIVHGLDSFLMLIFRSTRKAEMWCTLLEETYWPSNLSPFYWTTFVVLKQCLAIQILPQTTPLLSRFGGHGTNMHIRSNVKHMVKFVKFRRLD